MCNIVLDAESQDRNKVLALHVLHSFEKDDIHLCRECFENNAPTEIIGAIKWDNEDTSKQGIIKFDTLRRIWTHKDRWAKEIQKLSCPCCDAPLAMGEMQIDLFIYWNKIDYICSGCIRPQNEITWFK